MIGLVGLAAIPVSVLACWLMVRKARLQNEAKLELTQQQIKALEEKLEALQKTPAPAPAEPVQAASTLVYSSVQTNDRAKVLKLDRLGRTPEQISGAIGMPEPQVRMLLKINGIVTEQMRSSIDRGISK